MRQPRSIRLQQIKTRIVEHPLDPSRIIVSPAGIHDRSRFLEVTVAGATAQRGYGEAATTPLWSGEAAETAKWLVEHLFAPVLIGNTFDHPSEALAQLDSVTIGNSFTKAAVETAIWDLWAREQGVRATELFGDRPPVLSIPTRGSIGCYDVPKTVRIASEFWRQGVRTLKFKIGSRGIDDVARLRAVRDALGDDPVFTVDGNGAYGTADEALPAVEKLLPFRLALIEQPTARDRIGQLGAFRQRIGVPVMADEAVFTPDHLAEALACDAFDVLSLYPGKNGGLSRCLAMARTAAAAGKRCAIGSNLETDLGQASMAALAAAVSAFPVQDIPCDFQAVLFYPRSAVDRPLRFQDGQILLPDGIGFGVDPLP